jgi:hypothetical protein
LAGTKLTLGHDLGIDGDTEAFARNEAASALLAREYHGPFVPPKENEI